MNYELAEFINKDIVFIGTPTEGTSFQAFIQKYAQIKSFQTITITDENRKDYDKQLATLNPELVKVVKSDNYPGRLLSVSYTTPTKVFFECTKQLGAKTIGITGTKGKSTTASLIYRMLQQGGLPSLFSGNNGTPLLDLLFEANQQSILVLELSSFQLADLDVSPDMAVITNLTRDHIDYHGNLEAYWEAKRNIVRFMTAENTVVFNPKTEIVFHWLADIGAKQIQINPEEVVDMSKSQLIGDKNKYNYLMAKAAAQAFGVDTFSCQHILKNFKPLAHRLDRVRSVRGITFVDDAISYDPDSTIADVTSCVREVAPVGCVMIGGRDVGYDYTELVKLLSTLLIPKLILFPETGAKIKALLPESYTPEVFETSDIHEAVMWAAEHCPSGSVCLLSSASPTDNLWKNYEEKGELFQKAILGLSITA